MDLEIKNALGGTIEDVDMVGNRIVMYAASFDTIDSHSDIIQKGAFTKTITENMSRVRHLWQHDDTKPVGIPEEMKEDHKGLYVVSKISDTALGRDLLTLVRDGVMNENSIGFYTIKSQKDEQKGLRMLTELKLKEYSSVTWASNENAVNLGIKALMTSYFDKQKLLQKSLRTGNLTDETYLLLESKAAQLEAAIEDLLDQSLVDSEPTINVVTQQVENEPVEEGKSMIVNQWDEFIQAYKNQ